MKYLTIAAILLTGCAEYRTKNYGIRKDAVALVILDYQKHAELHGTVNNGGEVAIVFRDQSIPVLFLSGVDAKEFRK